MGCWNETCAISRMSIRAGEAVRFLPIVQNPYHIEKVTGFPVKEGEELPVVLKGGSGCYIGDLWMPLCYPIRGEYNDYGTIEDVPEKTDKDKAELKQFIDAFKINCVPLNQGDNEYHDAAIKNFTLSEILEALQEGRCFMNYHSDLPQHKKDRLVPIGWMMIKESVWQSLLDTDIKKSGEVWERKGEPDRLTVKGIRAGLAETVDSYMSRERQQELMKKIEDKTVAPEEIDLFFENATKSLGAEHQRRWVWNMSPIDPPDLNKDLLDVAAEMEYVNSMMSILRISYQPTTGSGSQRDNYKLWKLMNKSWIGIITKEFKEKAEEDRKWNTKYKLMLSKEKDEKEKKKTS